LGVPKGYLFFFMTLLVVL